MDVINRLAEVFVQNLQCTEDALYMGSVNPLKDTLKPQSNGPLYSNTVIGTLAVDGWAVIFGTARRVLGRLWPHSVRSSYQM